WCRPAAFGKRSFELLTPVCDTLGARWPIPPQALSGPSRGGRMNCKTCGADILSGRKFCTACGAPVTEAPLTVVCIACSNPVDANFCGECGRALKVAPASAAT